VIAPAGPPPGLDERVERRDIGQVLAVGAGGVDQRGDLDQPVLRVMSKN
jgi:co-chaperonin GroES (HSP10)